MIQTVQRYLRGQSYQVFMSGNIPCFVKAFEGELAVVQLYTASTFVMMDAGRMIDTRNELENKLLIEHHVPEEIRIRFLTIVVVKDEVSDAFQSVAEELPGLWFVSEQQKRVVVYETQSTNYFRLYDGLVDAVELFQGGQSELAQMKTYARTLQPVTVTLVILNVLAYLWSSFGGNVLDATYMYSVGAVTWQSILQQGEYYRLFSSMFLHFGIEHLFSNMVSLLFLGSMLEKRLGHVKYTILYLSSGLVAGLASVGVNYMKATSLGIQGEVVSAGASGAIFGVIGGLIAVVFLQKIIQRKQLVATQENGAPARKRNGVYEEISMRSLLWMAFFSVFAGFTTGGVDNSAHVGGLVFGLILTFFLAIKR